MNNRDSHLLEVIEVTMGPSSKSNHGVGTSLSKQNVNSEKWKLEKQYVSRLVPIMMNKITFTVIIILALNE